MFTLRQKYKDESNDLLQALSKLLMNALNEIQNRKDINELYNCKSQQWIETEYDDNVLDYWKLANGNFTLKMKKDDGLDGDNDIKNTLPSRLGAFTLGNTKRIMNNFIGEKNGFYNNSLFYGDMNSTYIEKQYWDVLDKSGLVGSNLCRGENHYKSGDIYFGLCKDPKIKYCSTINEFGVIEEHKTS